MILLSDLSYLRNLLELKLSDLFAVFKAIFKRILLSYFVKRMFKNCVNFVQPLENSLFILKNKNFVPRCRALDFFSYFWVFV